MSQRWTLPVLLLAFGLFYLLPLPFHGLWIPDETRYAQMSQEMLLTGKWAAPHFMGFRYFEKPAAGYWFIAIGQWLFGQNLFGVRVASALSLGLSVVLTYLAANRLWGDKRKSLICAVLYMSFGLVAGQAGYANLDPQFTLWVNLSLVALWFAVDSHTTRARLVNWGLLGFACGMGFMTKGFLAWVFPVLIAAPYMMWQKRFGELVRYGLFGVLVAVLVSAPWALMVNAQESDFWSFFFWHEHIRRFAGDDAQHSQPFWFYLPLLAASSLPWALLLPATARHAWQARSNHKVMFVLLWLLLPLAFLSLSRGKLPTYILPCMLPLALLVGHALNKAMADGKTRMLRANALLNLAIALIGLSAIAWLQMKKPVFVDEPQHLALALVALASVAVVNLLAWARPLRFWAAPAVGMGLLVAMLPSALPDTIVNNKTPDAFIARHTDELRQVQTLLSNDLGAASALAWHVARPTVYLYNTVGETKYGQSYPDASGRQVELDQVQAWMTEARRKGSVGVVMRVKSDDEVHEVELLPKDGKRFEQGNLKIFIFDQAAP
ncbi:4-amino-4-deoxy-L-arabinose transferase [Pseudomonas sp. M47T1]|uniref:lipid IV(A) 4-amino-4-deoxy-L-arabinosyltransferase n=1 Tax=unclassified Pseudomonas TaxID=196821 RepID=UPI0002608AD1|nr:lipid IV(A) 4-amino-4-deoxy-L-arabinosyltransferase [Pseudomonas sp. M47T1]EIK95859.1 4-amino-4-deoxy-L-arabinose transferase [Pseudomonas sp. M47T1]